MRLGRGRGGREHIRGKRARGLCADRCIFKAIADDESAGCEIAQALMIARYEDGDGAHGVEERDLVDVADEIACH